MIVKSLHGTKINQICCIFHFILCTSSWKVWGRSQMASEGNDHFCFQKVICFLDTLCFMTQGKAHTHFYIMRFCWKHFPLWVVVVFHIAPTDRTYSDIVSKICLWAALQKKNLCHWIGHIQKIQLSSKHVVCSFSFGINMFHSSYIIFHSLAAEGFVYSANIQLKCML